MLQRKPTTKYELMKAIQQADIQSFEVITPADRQGAAALFKRAASLSEKKPVAIIMLIGK
jgi:hypothetical protein